MLITHFVINLNNKGTLVVKIKKSIKYIILLSIIALFLSMTYVSAENVTITDNDKNAENINIETQDVTMYYKWFTT